MNERNEFQEFIHTFGMVALVLLPFYIVWLILRGIVKFLFD